mmetsp:Transcript_5056/g.14929  ORF Transcript_5056/g.14929 Transcript_5056/m.14929 type:complete len:221 (+) Transcript_5056:1041-1703(+)
MFWAARFPLFIRRATMPMPRGVAFGAGTCTSRLLKPSGAGFWAGGGGRAPCASDPAAEDARTPSGGGSGRDSKGGDGGGAGGEARARGGCTASPLDLPTGTAAARELPTRTAAASASALASAVAEYLEPTSLEAWRLALSSSWTSVGETAPFAAPVVTGTIRPATPLAAGAPATPRRGGSLGRRVVGSAEGLLGSPGAGPQAASGSPRESSPGVTREAQP